MIRMAFYESGGLWKSLSGLFGGGGQQQRSPATGAPTPSPSPTGLTGQNGQPFSMPSVTPGRTVNQPVNMTPFSGGQPQPQPRPQGGGGGPQGQVAGASTEFSMEGQPGEPQLDFSAINDALGRLDSFEQETRGLLGGGEAQAESFKSAAISRAEGSRAEGKAAVEAREGKNRKAGMEAEGQQRRGFSEIAQQFAGRFGRSGFGQGVIGQVAESTLGNIGKIRAGVEETVQQLFTQKQQIDQQLNQAVEQASYQAETIKQQGKAQLQQALGEIGQQRYALQSQKAGLVNQALENYRQQIIDVNARNQQFMQTVELAKVRTDEAIREAQARAANTMKELASFESGNTVYSPKTNFGVGGTALDTDQTQEGTQLPTGFGEQGDYYTYPRPASLTGGSIKDQLIAEEG